MLEVRIISNRFCLTIKGNFNGRKTVTEKTCWSQSSFSISGFSRMRNISKIMSTSLTQCFPKLKIPLKNSFKSHEYIGFTFFSQIPKDQQHELCCTK